MNELIPQCMVANLADIVIVQIHRESMDVSKLADLSNVPIAVIDKFLLHDEPITWQQLGDILYAITFRRMYNGKK